MEEREARGRASGLIVVTTSTAAECRFKARVPSPLQDDATSNAFMTCATDTLFSARKSRRGHKIAKSKAVSKVIKDLNAQA